MTPLFNDLVEENLKSLKAAGAMALAGACGFGGCSDANDVPRGIRNNNPGNIEKGQDWNGERKNQKDSRFEEFQSPEYGIRAMGMIIRTYHKKYGLNTIEGIVTRWAPPNENDTENYIKVVSQISGINPKVELNLFNNGKVYNRKALSKILKAMIRMENSYEYPDETIEKAINMLPK